MTTQPSMYNPSVSGVSAQKGCKKNDMYYSQKKKLKVVVKY